MAWSGIEAACKVTEDGISREINLIERDLRDLQERIYAPKAQKEMEDFLRSILPVQKTLSRIISKSF